MTTNTVLVVGLIVGVVLLAVIVGMQRSRSVSTKLKFDMPLKLKKAVNQYPELKKLTVEAVQNEASHFDYLGPSIFFYRVRDGQIERCFAEFSPAVKHFEWVWPPTQSWHTDVDKMPESAIPISTPA